MDYGSAKNTTVGTSGKLPHNFNMQTAEFGLIWSPIAGLEINPSVAYGRIAVSTAVPNGFNSAVTIKSDDQYLARIRVARSF